MSTLLEGANHIKPDPSLKIVGTGPSKDFLAQIEKIRGTEGSAPLFTLQDEKCAALFKTKEAMGFAVRNRVDQPIDIWPGIWSTDPDNQSFRIELAQEYNRSLPSNVDELGQTFGNGVRSDWNGLLHLPGYGMHPTTVPVYDNTQRREDRGLVHGPTKQWHLNLFVTLLKLCLDPTDMVPEKLSIRRGSSSCIPHMTTNDAKKVEIAKHGMRTALKAGELAMSGKAWQAFEEYYHLGAYVVVFRLQSSDKVTVNPDGSTTPKVRQIAPWLFAATSGAQGQLVNADKSLNYLGNGIDPRLSAMRMRVASGGPGTTNYALMAHAQAVRAMMYKKWPFTWKATTPSDKEEKIHQFEHAIFADVSDHDQLFPGWFIDLALDTMRNINYDGRFVALLGAAMRMPYYVGANARDEGQVLIGDPADPTCNFGLSSGIAYTDLFGSWWMTSVYVIAMIEHSAPWLIQSFEKPGRTAADALSRILSGEAEVGVMDKSDDAIMLFRREAVSGARAWHESLARAEESGEKFPSSPYMDLSYEVGGKYLGTVALFPLNKRLSEIKMVGDIVSSKINRWSPEYAVNWSNQRDRTREKRPFPGLSAVAEAQVFGSAPAFQEAREIEEFLFKKHHGESLAAYFAALRRHDEDAMINLMNQRASAMRDNLKAIGVSGLTTLELLALYNPEYLHYKISKTDIRPQVFDILMGGVEVEYVEDFLSEIHPFFKTPSRILL